ncbi:putative dynein outer arm light chain [Paratrimastix pyriformis]|uniref:Dynein outer arm light chain n=1 Tax=Paratrimastix pyriformis TaxID=342808 RepID=A0ABQ8ULG1_9EUKA|nr:putative dynein outer arm light chain [Paratrimastix pyriformis]
MKEETEVKEAAIPNTFQTEPKKDERFRPADVRHYVDDLLTTTLKTARYNAAEAPLLARELSKLISQTLVQFPEVGYPYNPPKEQSSSSAVPSSAVAGVAQYGAEHPTTGRGFPRYKHIVQVTIGEVKDQGMRVASRSLWDPKVDSCVSCHFQNNSLFCVAMVFGIYFE